jgi:phenylpropionate dioxygenase-like ring-hydroxylating dioxygenase large terminal subunit
MGEVMRRYWQPVGLSSDVTAAGKPKEIRVMGEELVLFRDDNGKPGLLGLHCSHRLTSLAYGRVEDGGIRCPFHGWLYDVGGKCLEQPAEPEPFCERIRHLSYPCEESGGLIFAYMGPEEKKPLLPRYEVLVRKDGTRKAGSYKINSNFLQNLEGALDTAHASFLHVDHWSTMKREILAMPKRTIEFTETDYGIWQKSMTHLSVAAHGRMLPIYGHFFMPAGFMRIAESPTGKSPVQKFQSWYVPADDTHTVRYQVAFTPLDKEGRPYIWKTEEEHIPPGPENDYFRNYDAVDTISGIPVNAPGTAIKGFLSQDSMVNETQGLIADRKDEHLGAMDKILTALRVSYLLAVDEVRRGRDPKHILRDPKKNLTVYIRGNDEIELA